MFQQKKNKEILYMLSSVVVLENRRNMKHMHGGGCYGQCSADLYGHMGGTFGYIDQHSELYWEMEVLHFAPPKI